MALQEIASIMITEIFRLHSYFYWLKTATIYCASLIVALF